MNSLSPEGCRTRQSRLRQQMARHQLDAVLLCESRYVHYFTGHWTKAHQFSALLITPDAALLSTPFGVEFAVADEAETYISSRHSTLVDDRRHAALEPLRARMTGRIGCDGGVPFDAVDDRADVCHLLRDMRRTKDADEVSLIRQAITGAEAAYAKAREILAPGVSEVHIYAQMLAAATEAVGEPVGEMGNDFRSGAGGGAPRVRPVEDGELMPLDVSIWVRGYSCDLCRTFAVGSISQAQRDAHAAVTGALDFVESQAKPGASCLALHKAVEERLNTGSQWTFPHHLGHGIGLSPHEAPRLNPHWDDVFQPGDVFTAEPGVYGEILRSGIRIEHNYLVTDTGIERLSNYSTDL